MKIISRTMLTANLIELMTSGTSVLSKARVDAATAVSMVDDKAEKADMRTYVIEACLTSAGTKTSANC